MTDKILSKMMNEAENLVTHDMEETVVLNGTFASIYTKTGLQESQVPEAKEQGRYSPGERRSVQLIPKQVGHEKSIGPNGIHPQELREMAVNIRPLSVIFEQT